MSVPVLTLNLFLFAIQNIRAQQTVCPTSCCECILGGQDIHCDGSKDFPEFICNVTEVIEKLELSNIDKPELDEKLWTVTQIEYLIIVNSPIRIITEIIDGRKSLKRLKLINISVSDEWKWGPVFQQFEKLMVFHLKDTQLTSDVLIIEGNAENTTNNQMISFSINNCGIRSIKSNIIKEWVHLKMISLAHNCINELDREWLPTKLEYLWSFDLSYNNISYIRPEFFTNMTALRKLRLDNNGFTTLHVNWFQHIWDGLSEFWIDHNPMVCDKNLAWIPNATHPTFFDEGSCILNDEVHYFHSFRNGELENIG